MDKTSDTNIIHLVSFNVPYPPDYGGVIDVFYKISALKQLGAGVILHCFSYGRSRSRTLERECLQVHYYRRDLNLFHIFRREPFIVLSRRNQSLLNNLLSDRNPVIFEGLHTTHLLDHPALANRIKMVRTHNIEHIYYRNLAANEKNLFKKLFFNAEARKLERYEPKLSKASLLLTISPGDTDYFRTKYGRVLFVGPFHPAEGCRSSNGKGDYVLVHGDFSTSENDVAARFLLNEVAVNWSHKTLFAGKRPSEELMHAASALKHVKVVPNPSVSQMTELITNAHVCLLNASQPSGMKLKLINSLCSGRHIVASAPVVAGTRLESLCNIVSNKSEWVSMTERLMHEDFTPEMRANRNFVLSQVADNNVNARRIIEFLNTYNPER